MRILGIDPGSLICGYGVIDKTKTGIQLIEYGVVKAARKHKTIPARLTEIFLRLEQVLERTSPEIAAFETMFYSKNAQSLMKLAHARGVAMLAASLYETAIFEYSPKEVKKSVTGNGSASKEQVSFMVKRILNIDETPDFFDSTDALAVAICHSMKAGKINAGPSNWKDFIKNNPDRVIKR